MLQVSGAYLCSPCKFSLLVHILTCQNTLLKTSVELQSDMQEGTASSITLQDMTGSVLRLIISHIYGKLNDIPHKELVPLFLAADAHQVRGP